MLSYASCTIEYEEVAEAVLLFCSRINALLDTNMFAYMQMCILDGNAYDAKCLEAGQEREEDLDGCSLLLNNKVQLTLWVVVESPRHCIHCIGSPQHISCWKSGDTL